MAEIRQVLSEKDANCCHVLGSLPGRGGLSVVWETMGPKAALRCAKIAPNAP